MLMRSEGIDVIAVDDQEDILELSKLFLERFEEDLSLDTTVDPEEVVDLVAEDAYDAVLSDFNMPVMDGLELLEEVRDIDEDLPFILYTGKGSEEVAAEAVNLGVTDYFRKEAGTDHYQMIGDRIVDAVENYRSERELEVFAAVVEHSDNPILVTDTESNILYANPAFETVTGYSEEEILGENPRILNSGRHDTETFKAMYEALEKGEIYRIEDMTNIDSEGQEYHLEQTLVPILDSRDMPEFYAGISDVQEL